jgi:hypothetical protein
VGPPRLSLGLVRAVACRDVATVWASTRPPDDNEEVMERQATRLVGPVPSDQAHAFINRLRKVLEEAGLTVRVDVAADD